MLAQLLAFEVNLVFVFLQPEITAMQFCGKI